MSDSARLFHPEVLKRIASLELRARQVVDGFLSGMHRSRYKGLSVEFATHRQYAPGDDLRHIDWRVFGRLDKPFIKEHEVETNMQVHLLLDGSESMAYPEHGAGDRMTKWDYAATMTACLAHLLTSQQDAVGLMLFDEAVRTELAPSTRRASLHGVVERVAAHRPARRTNVAGVFDRLADRVGRRGMVILMSDLLTDVDALIAGLQRLKHLRRDVLVFHVLDADEIDFPFLDRTQFEGLEDPSLHVLTDPQSLRAAYLERLSAFLARVRGACLNARIDYTLYNTAEPLDVALARCLAARQAARG